MSINSIHNIPIFVINLIQDIDKKNHMQKELDKFGLDYEFEEAVYGKELDDEYINSIYSKERSIRVIGRELTRGEIGCALSHKHIYERIINEDMRYALILEDDIDIDKNIINILNSIEKQMLQTDIIFLGYHSCNNRKISVVYNFFCKYRLKNNSFLSPLLENICGTHGYLVTNSGAKKLLDSLKLIEKPIDHYTGDINSLNIYGVVPIPITINEQLGKLSSIGDDRNEYNNKSVIYKIKQFLLQSTIVFTLYLYKYRVKNVLKVLFLYRKCSKPIEGKK